MNPLHVETKKIRNWPLHWLEWKIKGWYSSYSVKAFPVFPAISSPHWGKVERIRSVTPMANLGFSRRNIGHLSHLSLLGSRVLKWKVYILQEFAGESKGRFPLIHLSTFSTIQPVVQLLASLEHWNITMQRWELLPLATITDIKFLSLYSAFSRNSFLRKLDCNAI